MKKITEKAFTLVELLIVIGIIGILAVTLLIALNPQEAQRKSRDSKRVKDLQTMQAIMEQFINDPGRDIPDAWGAVGGVNSATFSDGVTSATGVTQMPCNDNWLGLDDGGAAIDVCQYAKFVPTDPSNNQQREVNDASVAGNRSQQVTIYQMRTVAVNSTDYEMRVRLESASNLEKITNDGGDNNDWYELFTASNAAL